MTTLETVILKRMEEFKQKTASLPEITRLLKESPDDPKLRKRFEKLQADETEEIEYLLKAAPFIKRLENYDDPVDREETPLRSGSGLDGVIKETRVSKRSQTFADYLETVEGKCLDSKMRGSSADDIYTCPCGESYSYNTVLSTLICETCGRTQYHIEGTSRNLSYTEEVTANSSQVFTYNRFSHLCEWLNSIQAKENTDVPEHVIEAVKAEFRKEGTITRGDIKPTKVRAYLKKLGLAKYYEHQTYIAYMLNGTPPPTFPRELENKFKTMFLTVQAPFERHCPPSRKNFLSYQYVLYKFCELLGERKYLKYFKLLKSHTKLHEQDVIWKKICEQLDWEYVPSV